jgi:hypothetical protein
MTTAAQVMADSRWRRTASGRPDGNCAPFTDFGFLTLISRVAGLRTAGLSAIADV